MLFELVQLYSVFNQIYTAQIMKVTGKARMKYPRRQPKSKTISKEENHSYICLQR